MRDVTNICDIAEQLYKGQKSDRRFSSTKWFQFQYDKGNLESTKFYKSTGGDRTTSKDAVFWLRYLGAIV